MVENVAIMAGGQSRRFNRDKTLEILDGRRLIEYPADMFRGRVKRLAVVAKDCSKYSFLGIECVRDIYEQQCPMVGILSVLKAFNAPVFVIAADTPFVLYSHAEKLWEHVTDADAVVPVIFGKHHPLYACYNVGMIPVFEDAVSRGDFSLMKSFDRAKVVYLDESQILSSENEKKSFININTEADIKSINMGGFQRG